MHFTSCADQYPILVTDFIVISSWRVGDTSMFDIKWPNALCIALIDLTTRARLLSKTLLVCLASSVPASLKAKYSSQIAFREVLTSVLTYDRHANLRSLGGIRFAKIQSGLCHPL